MAKTKISQFDAVASNNTDINSVNVAEGCPPSGINNAIREMASLLKKQEVGTDAMTSPDINGGTIDGATIGASSASTGAFTNLVVDNITIDGTEIDLSSGDLTVDVAGDIILSAAGGEIRFDDGSQQEFVIDMNDASTKTVLRTLVSDADLTFEGNDGGSGFTALTLDMSDAGTAIFNHDVKLVDNGKAIFGAGGDLEIYHDGSNSYIADEGTGGIIMSGGTLTFKNQARDETHATMTVNGAVELYHNNSKKIETTSSGVDVTGGVTYTGDLVSTTSGISNFKAGVNAGNSIQSGGNFNILIGDEAGTAITTGDSNIAIGHGAGDALTTGTNNVAVGHLALSAEDGHGLNVAVGYEALKALNAGGDSHNVAVGYQAGKAFTTGQLNSVIGSLSGTALTEAGRNTAVGYATLATDTQGSRSTAIGYGALSTQNFSSATNSNNTAVGHAAGASVTTGVSNTLIGSQAGNSLTDADYNVAIGNRALESDTKGNRTIAIGFGALDTQNFTSSTNTQNVAIGFNAGTLVSTANRSTFVGYRSGQSITTGFGNAFFGNDSGINSTGQLGTFIGDNAGQNATGNSNTLIGQQAGYLITSGGNNTVIGRFDGNQDGLDIRTSSNNIVLSDGDGNVQLAIQSGGCVTIGDQKTPFSTSATLNVDQLSGGFPILCHRDGTGDGVQISFRNDNGQVGRINTSGSATSYVTSSDYRLKENVIDMTGAIDRVKQLLPKRFNFIIDSDTTVDGFLAHEVTAVPEAISGEKDAVDADGNIEAQGIDQSKLVPLLTGALKEAIAKIEALETRVATLEGE